MRTISTDHERILSGTGRQVKLRVFVKDSGGTYRDLTSYPGFNSVLSASWGEDVDSNGIDATVRLKRDQHDFSLAPLKEKSAPNMAFNPAGSFSPLLDVARMLKFEWALIPESTAVQSADWNLAFEGYVDKISWADEAVEISCRDKIAQLEDTFIESERVYAHAQGGSATKGLLVFGVSTVYALNELVMPSETRRNGHYYKVTTAGTSAATEPAWATGSGSTTSSGTAVFTEQGSTSSTAGTAVETVIGQLISDNITSGPSLSTPSSPGWAIRWYLQDRTRVLDAVRTLVDQIGWDLRFRYVSGSFTLRFTEPNRGVSSSDRTFGPSQYFAISQCDLDVNGIRNVVKVVYSDSQDKDAGGVPKRKSVTSTDSTSVTRYGRRFMEIAEASTSNIDSSSEATDEADAVLSDLATPNAEVACEMPFFPFVELGDYYRFSSNNRHWDANLDLASIGYQHECGADGRASTIITCRGKPSAGYRRHHARAVANVPNQDATRTILADLDTPATPTATSVVGGIAVVVGELQSKHSALSGYELHVSESSSFTPSSSTLKARGQQKELVATDLQPGLTYYTKTVPYSTVDGKIVRGLPSEELTITAGKASTQYLDLQWWSHPLNGNFYSPNDFTSKPNNWTVITGTWGVDFGRLQDGVGIVVGGPDGGGVSSTSVVLAEISSDFFQLEESSTTDYYALVFSVATASVADPGDFVVHVDGYDSDGSLTQASFASTDLTFSNERNIYSLTFRLSDVAGTVTQVRIRIEKTVAAEDTVADFKWFLLHREALRTGQPGGDATTNTANSGTWVDATSGGSTFKLAEGDSPFVLWWTGWLECTSATAEVALRLKVTDHAHAPDLYSASQTIKMSQSPAFVTLAFVYDPFAYSWWVDDSSDDWPLASGQWSVRLQFSISSGTGTVSVDDTNLNYFTFIGGSFTRSI